MGSLGLNRMGLQRGVGENPDTGTAKYGSELVSNGGFADGTDWVTGTGWTIGSGVLTGSAGSASATTQAGIAAPGAGETHRLAIEVTAVSAGSVSVQYGGTATASFTTVGVHVEEIVTADTSGLEVLKDSAFAGSVDNVSVREVIR